jgi:hypothetical protein
VNPRSFGFQYGLGKQRASKTKSASKGKPCLDMQVNRPQDHSDIHLEQIMKDLDEGALYDARNHLLSLYPAEIALLLRSLPTQDYPLKIPSDAAHRYNRQQPLNNYDFPFQSVESSALKILKHITKPPLELMRGTTVKAYMLLQKSWL